MSFVVSGKIEVNSAQAKAELAATAAETQKLGTAAGGLDRSARQAAAGTRALEGAAAAATGDLRAMTQAAALAEAQNQGLGRSGQLAAGSVGNMVAQLNDVAMMAAAGQNPLQLAIQQGTQITQAFGNAGAAGAARMLGAGLLSMLSPLNLATIGVIAGGVALSQWAMEAFAAEDAAASFEDQIDSLRGIMEGMESATDILKMSQAELKQEFGAAGEAAQEAARRILELQIVAAQDALRSTIQNGAEAFDAFIGAAEMSRTSGAQVAEAVRNLRDQLGLTGQEAFRVSAAFRAVRDAASFEDRVAALSALDAALVQAGVSLDQLPGPIRDALLQAGELTLETARLTANLEDSVDAVIDLRLGAPGAGWMSAAIGETNALISRLIEADRVARSMRAQQQFNRENAVYSGRGADPRQFMPGYGAFKPSDEVVQRADELLNPSSGSGTGSSGGGAARAEVDAVERLIERKRQELELLRVTDPVMREMIRNREMLADATQAQRAEVEEVIAALERERAIQGAADFARGAVKGFFSDLRNSADGLTGALDNVLQKLIDVGLEALVFGEGPLAGLLGLGGGGIFGLFGGGGGGTGGFGLPMPFADGGMIYGKGGPRDDRQLVAASPGEFIVNAGATARNRAVLEYLNGGGRLPGYADGGLVGGAASIGAAAPVGAAPAQAPVAQGAAGEPRVELHWHIDARGAVEGVAGQIKAEIDRRMPEMRKQAVDAVMAARARGVAA